MTKRPFNVYYCLFSVPPPLSASFHLSLSSPDQHVHRVHSHSVVRSGRNNIFFTREENAINNHSKEDDKERKTSKVGRISIIIKEGYQEDGRAELQG